MGGEGEGGEGVRKGLLSELGRELEGVEAQRVKYEREAKEAEGVIAGLSERVVEVFRVLYGDGEEAREMLGGVEEVSQTNVVEVLGYCEAEVNRLIDLYEQQKGEQEIDDRARGSNDGASGEDAEEGEEADAVAREADYAGEVHEEASEAQQQQDGGEGGVEAQPAGDQAEGAGEAEQSGEQPQVEADTASEDAAPSQSDESAAAE